MVAVTVFGGTFWRSSPARKCSFASFCPIGPFGLTLGGQIAKGVKRTARSRALFDFVRFPPNTHQAMAPDRRFCLTRAALFVKFPILHGYFGLPPILWSAPGSRRRRALDQTKDSCADRFRQPRPSANQSGQVGVILRRIRQAKRQDAYCAVRNCRIDKRLWVSGQGFDSPWG